MCRNNSKFHYLKRSSKTHYHMKKIIKFAPVAAIALFALLLAAPAIVSAQNPGYLPTVLPGGEGEAGEVTIGGWVGVLITVVRWFYTIIFIVAVLFILLAAWNFITSKGDPNQAKLARTQLLYAVIGIAVALISYTIIFFVNNALNAPSL
jgi:hypothetical protein